MWHNRHNFAGIGGNRRVFRLYCGLKAISGNLLAGNALSKILSQESTAKGRGFCRFASRGLHVRHKMNKLRSVG
jgi:hypothetical protein